MANAIVAKTDQTLPSGSVNDFTICCFMFSAVQASNFSQVQRCDCGSVSVDTV